MAKDQGLQDTSKSFTNSFTKGLNTDVDVSVYPKDSYVNAENFRLASIDGQGTLETIRGNKKVLTSSLGSS